METFSVNRLAETLECDRSTMVRALKNVPGDAEKTPGRPTYKIATAARALEAHRRNVGTSTPGGNGVSSPPPEFDVFDRAFDRMSALPTLAKRRAAAIKLIPVIENMMRAMRAHAAANREDPYVTGLRGDEIYRLTLVGFRVPCQWDHDEVWKNLCVEPD
jgi:hypothetical protein